MTQYNDPSLNRPAAPASHVDVNTVVSRPIDRVRWGPIVAGLFAALSTLALLSVLGMAVGLSAYDPGDRARNFGMGAGIWGAISMLLAFFIGGWLAARSAAVRGHSNGLLNGALVWAVAIPVMIYMIAGGLSSVANTATNAADAAASAASNSNRIGQEVDQQVDRVISASANDPNASADQMTDQQRQEALQAARRSAWGTFISLCLGLAAASAGGWVGARDRGYDRDRETDLSPTT